MSRGKKGLIALALLVAIGSIVWVVVFKKDSDLLDACERCDAAEVERLLQSGANPNAAKRRGIFLVHETTALMLAASCINPNRKNHSDPAGDPRLVKLLLEKGADVNKARDTTSTALHYAVRWVSAKGGSFFWGSDSHFIPAPGNTEVVRLLVAAGANINAGLGRGRTPLDQAESANYDCANKDVVRMLIEHGAVSSYGDKCRFILTALECHLHDLLELFIGLGCDANAKYVYISDKNPYLIVRAAHEGNRKATEAHRETLKGNARAAEEKKKAAEGIRKAVKRLLEATPKIDDDMIAWAVSENCIELVKELLDRGADANYRMRDHDPNERYPRDKMAGSLLCIAAASGHVEMVNLLIDRGADVNARTNDGNGWGPLDAASYHLHWKVADILKSHGAQKYQYPFSR